MRAVQLKNSHMIAVFLFVTSLAIAASGKNPASRMFPDVLLEVARRCSPFIARQETGQVRRCLSGENDGRKSFGDEVLLHPHGNEGSFTRPLANVRIPDGVKMSS